MTPTDALAVLLRGGRIVDPGAQRDEIGDLRIERGRVAEIGSLTPKPGENVVDVAGLTVMPGLVDLCVHLREPGFEAVETIESGSRAAIAGGFTSIAAMPDTDPPIDNEASATFVRLKGEEAGAARVYPVGTLTRDRKGEVLSEMAGMTRAGTVAFSDEDHAVERTDVFLKAMRYADMLGRPVLTRCEDPWLRGEGVASSGLTSDLLGLPSISPGTEEVMLGRNLHLAQLQRAGLHLLHLSTCESLTLFERARRAGSSVTCSVTPAHLLLDESALSTYDSALRYMPPLRTEVDRMALVDAVTSGLIDAITSDHTPRAENEKRLEFVFAEPGTSGLETTFATLHTKLVVEGDLPLSMLVSRLSTRPAEILGIPGGRLMVGDLADVVCVDLDERWTIDPLRFNSRSRVTPFQGWSVQGRVRHVFVGGRFIYRDLAFL